jgi:hypothetical protein
MEPIQQHEVEKFFNRYETRFNEALRGGEPDIDGTVDSFSSHFIEASPLGVMAGKNDEQFRDAIRQGWASYRQMGILSMEILSKQITILDDYHAMVKIHWNSNFVRKNNTPGEIDFDVFYLVQKKDDRVQIFAYITGDEQQALKDQGLIP